MSKNTKLEPAMQKLLDGLVADLEKSMSENEDAFNATHDEDGNEYVTKFTLRETKIITAALGATSTIELAHKMGQMGFEAPDHFEAENLFNQLAECFNL